MRLFIIGLLFLIACSDKPLDTENITSPPTKYLSLDSIPLEIWESMLQRQGKQPYELEKSVFDRKLNLRFDYYIFNNDGQLFPLKLVTISNDSFSFTLDFKEERRISSYNLGDSIIPTSTIGDQLNSAFSLFKIKNHYRHIFTYVLFNDVMNLEYVQPYHRSSALSYNKSVSISDINRFYNELEERGNIAQPRDWRYNTKLYDVYNLWDYTCFYKVTWKDSLEVECIFPENYTMLIF